MVYSLQVVQSAGGLHEKEPLLLIKGSQTSVPPFIYFLVEETT